MNFFAEQLTAVLHCFSFDFLFYSSPRTFESPYDPESTLVYDIAIVATCDWVGFVPFMSFPSGEYSLI